MNQKKKRDHVEKRTKKRTNFKKSILMMIMKLLKIKNNVVKSGFVVVKRLKRRKGKSLKIRRILSMKQSEMKEKR